MTTSATSRKSGPPRASWSAWLILFCGVVAVWPVPARANEIYKFDQTHSTIAFSVRHFFGAANGRFTKFNGRIEIDPEHPEKSSVTAMIRAASLDTANAKRDEHLRGSDFFDVAKFPELTFKSRSVKRTGAKNADITGSFTMHGVTREIVLHAQLIGSAEGGATHWHVTTAPIKRSEFDLRWSKSVEAVSMIGDEVVVLIEIEAERAQ